MGLLGFRLHNKLFLPVFEDYSNYFLQDVEAVIFNRNLQYKIFGNPDSGRIENYLKNSDEDISENTEGIFYKSDYDKDLGIMIITSGKQINKVLMTLFLILLIIMIAAYFLLYIVLKRYLDFVTGRLGALCMKMHDFSGNAEETEEA